jgi:acyl dehydratase
LSEPAKVGDALTALASPAIDRDVLRLFADASGDHNPVHIDKHFAMNAGLPDVIAHGMLGMAWLGRMVTNSVPQAKVRSLSGRFLGITHLGSTLTCRGRVTELFQEAGEPRARLHIEAVDQTGDVKISGEAVVAV